MARRIADSQPWLDRLADKAQPAVREMLDRHRRLHDLLDGTWLGTPLHPALTDVPIGSWVCAFALDTAAELSASTMAARSADAALAFGTVTAVPTALAGVGDWRDLTAEKRRIATLHGVLNVAGLTLTIASLAQRMRGRRRSGLALSATGLAVSGVAAHFGGLLSFGLGVRVNRSLFITPTAPAEFTAVLDEKDLPAGEMRMVDLHGIPVLLTRDQSGQPCAIANTCSHFGGPLASGERNGDVVTCPWHGSRFDVCTGQVIEGPAVFPQPAYETRTRNGKIELRRPLPGTPQRPAEKSANEWERAVDQQQPSFERDIRPLFRQKDIESMSQAFDLSSYQDVRANAEDIHQQLSEGNMPCDGAWPPDQVQTFHDWMGAGYPR